MSQISVVSFFIFRYFIFSFCLAIGSSSIACAAKKSHTARDTIAPSLVSFSLPASSQSLLVSGITLSATDNKGVTGFFLSESSRTPTLSSGWSATAPTSFSFPAAGSKTLYAWARDAAGNISAARSATVTITLPATLPSPGPEPTPPTSTARLPLEIANIKPAESGTPPIPATNRIFWAYPGVEYNIRAAVIGGAYPYAFSLSNAPAGMTIQQSTGQISWPNPTGDTGPISLTVADSMGTSVSTTWSIHVSADRFIFIDSNYTGPTEAGTLEQPYKTIATFLNNTSETAKESIVYFRGGNYALPVFHGAGSYPSTECKLNALGYSRPYKWIGYPGETALIDASGNHIATANVYFDNLKFSNFRDFGIRSDSSANYNMIRRCDWGNLAATFTLNGNQGFYYTNENTAGSYLVFQDNVFHDFTGAAAIGSLYRLNKLIIEDNSIFNFGGPGLTGIATAIAFKSELNNATIRGNRIDMASHNGTAIGDSTNGLFYDSAGTEISYNFFKMGSAVAHYFNVAADRSPPHPQLLTHYYRNTVIGEIVLKNIADTNCSLSGPFHFQQNIIINTTTGPSWAKKVNHIAYSTAGSPTSGTPENCIDATDNLTGTLSDNIVDQDGHLTPAYGSSIGKYGYEAP